MCDNTLLHCPIYHIFHNIFILARSQYAHTHAYIDGSHTHDGAFPVSACRRVAIANNSSSSSSSNATESGNKNEKHSRGQGIVQGNLHKFYVLFTQKANCIFSTTRTPFTLHPPPPTTHTYDVLATAHTNTHIASSAQLPRAPTHNRSFCHSAGRGRPHVLAAAAAPPSAYVCVCACVGLSHANVTKIAFYFPCM